MKTAIFSAIAASVLAPAAFAGVCLPQNDWCLDQSEIDEGQEWQTKYVGNVEVCIQAAPRVTKRKTTNGTTGIGIKNGSVNGEIDGSEFLEFKFSEDLIITRLEIGLLYDNGQFGDHPAEAALVLSDRGSNILQVTGHTTATWTGSGSVSNASIATERGGGRWVIEGDDILGGATSFLRLQSGNPGVGGFNGDFVFVSMCTRPIPAPGAMALLGLGGALVAKRRR
jgi:hypothetical protein